MQANPSADASFQSFVEFYVFNNGKPINIVLEHGALTDANDKGSNGAARFTIFDGSGPDGQTFPKPVSWLPMRFTSADILVVN